MFVYLFDWNAIGFIISCLYNIGIYRFIEITRLVQFNLEFGKSVKREFACLVLLYLDFAVCIGFAVCSLPRGKPHTNLPVQVALEAS